MKYLLSLTLCLGGLGCSPSRFVQPLPKGHYALVGALGGPLITYSSAVIPTPLSSLAIGYGLTDESTIFGGLHTTALLFKDLQLDLGATKKFVAQDGWLPAISVSPIANVVMALRDGAFKVWPELDINLYWNYIANGNYIYLNNANWFEFASTRGNGESQSKHWIPSLGLGHVFDGINWQYTFEARYIAIGTANTPNVVDYHGISGKGDIGLYLGLTRKF